MTSGSHTVVKDYLRAVEMAGLGPLLSRRRGNFHSALDTVYWWACPMVLALALRGPSTSRFCKLAAVGGGVRSGCAFDETLRSGGPGGDRDFVVPQAIAGAGIRRLGVWKRRGIRLGIEHAHRRTVPLNVLKSPQPTTPWAYSYSFRRASKALNCGSGRKSSHTGSDFR